MMHSYDVEMRTQHGWECVDCLTGYTKCEARRNARESMRVYQREQPGYAYRLRYDGVFPASVESLLD